MLDVSPDNLHKEVEAAETFRDQFTERVDALIERYHGQYFRSDKGTGNVVAENHAYEYLALMLPQVAYGSPRCLITAMDPNKTAQPPASPQVMQSNMGLIADALKQAMNSWAVQVDLGETLTQLATDFFFSYAVALVTTETQPGYEAFEGLVPKRPYVMRLSRQHFFCDAAAKSMDPKHHNGPRFMGHKWRCDKADLLADKKYIPEAVASLVEEQGVEEYDGKKSSSAVMIPKRGQVIGWDIWVPEERTSSDPGYNGTMHTIAVGASGPAVEIMKPRPYFGPASGPYIVMGAYYVPNVPFPLSPLVATAEKAEMLNAHEVQAANDAASYKHILMASTNNGSEAEVVKNVAHGEVITVKNASDYQDKEFGGVSDKQREHNALLRESLDRQSGLTDAARGAVTGDATATENSIAAQGTTARLAFMQSRYRKGVQGIFTAAVHFAFYGEDVIFQGLQHGQAQIPGKPQIAGYSGGLFPGQENMSPYDLNLSIEPYSLEHTSSVVIQKRMQDAWAMLVQAAPVIMQVPFINWRLMLERVFDTMNVGSVDELINMQMVAQMQQMQAFAPVGAQPEQMGVSGPPGKRPSPMQGLGQPQPMQAPIINAARGAA